MISMYRQYCQLKTKIEDKTQKKRPFQVISSHFLRVLRSFPRELVFKISLEGCFF